MRYSVALLLLLSVDIATTANAQDPNCRLQELPGGVLTYACDPVFGVPEGNPDGLPYLVYMGEPPFAEGTVLQECQGRCVMDSDCAEGLTCRRRDPYREPVGCQGNHLLRFMNYCLAEMSTGDLVLETNPSSPLIRCHGACLSDSDCQGGLECWMSEDPVPGCAGEQDVTQNYCYDPSDYFLSDSIPLEYLGEPPFDAPLEMCQGDCDSDWNCDFGLNCFKRADDRMVPGCQGAGIYSVDYCYTPDEGTLVIVRDVVEGTGSGSPAGRCEGTCQVDADCAGEFQCLVRTNYEMVPGCAGLGAHATNYCYDPADLMTDSLTHAPISEPSSSPTDAPFSALSSIPTASPFAVPSSSSSEAPVLAPSGITSASPLGLPISSPSTSPVTTPTDTPINSDGDTDRDLPTFEPQNSPSASPLGLPSSSPSIAPTKVPSSSPSASPFTVPSSSPSEALTPDPSSSPSASPFAEPSSSSPSTSPVTTTTDIPINSDGDTDQDLPTFEPQNSPSFGVPSSSPSGAPILAPSSRPSIAPTSVPSSRPSASPIGVPSSSPSDVPVLAPSSSPSTSPFGVPSSSPSDAPTLVPSSTPSTDPVDVPSSSPSIAPVATPTNIPINVDGNTDRGIPTASPTLPFLEEGTTAPVAATETPSSLASAVPSILPSISASASPSNIPSDFPTVEISTAPSSQATQAPTFNCQMSPMEREQAIGISLVSLSGVDAFSVSDSPQSQAYNWIVDGDPMALCPGDAKLVERYILAVLSFSLSSDSWTRCSTSPVECDAALFLSGGDVCVWDGIVCDSNGSVTALRLDELSLAGRLPQEIGSLQKLVEIDMDSNNLTGPIPSSVGQLEFLEIIDLDKNDLVGPIPDSIYGLSALRVIDLDGNSLSGVLSSEVGRLSQLYFLQLDFNLFSGGIPSEIGTLGGLKYLSLFGNSFTGAIPEDMCSDSSINRTIYANCNVCTEAECCTACLDV